MQDVILCSLSIAPQAKMVFTSSALQTSFVEKQHSSVCGMTCWVANKYREKKQKLVLLGTPNIYIYSQNSIC